jgi:hypothetical protein
MAADPGWLITTLRLDVKVQLARNPGPWTRALGELTMIGCCRAWPPPGRETNPPPCCPGLNIMACCVGILWPAPVMTCWRKIFGPEDMQCLVVGSYTVHFRPLKIPPDFDPALAQSGYLQLKHTLYFQVVLNS